MDYSKGQRADRLAAEYVLGTLRGRARKRFEDLLQAHPALRAAVADWQRRLNQLVQAVPAVEPPPQVWQRIERRLFPAPEPTGFWRRLGLWQGATAFAAVAALTLGVLLSQPAPVQPPVVVVLDASAAAATAGLQSASFVASVSADGRSLVLKPLAGVGIDARRALELWAVPAQGAPRSLGLIAGDRATTVLRTQLLKDTAAFAVSVEPPGGSPTGAPTGPIVSVGKLQL